MSVRRTAEEDAGDGISPFALAGAALGTLALVLLLRRRLRRRGPALSG